MAMNYEPKLCDECGHDKGFLDYLGFLGADFDLESGKVMAVVAQGRWYYPSDVPPADFLEWYHRRTSV